MPHAYCTECQARVTVRMGRCLLDHKVDPSTISDKRGRRVSRHPRREAAKLADATSARLPTPRGAGKDHPSLPHTEMAPPTRLVESPLTTPQSLRDAPAPQVDRPLPAPARPVPVPGGAAPADVAITSNRAPATGTLEQTRFLIADLWNTAKAEPDEGADLSPTEEMMLDVRGWARKAGAALLLLGLGLLGWGVFSLWNTDSASTESENAVRGQLETAIQELEPTLSDLADGAPVDPVEAPLAIDRAAAAARSLFAAAAAIDDPSARRQATTDAQLVLEATEILTRVHAYQAALVPVLDGPLLGGSPDEIQAAEVIATWQSEFENVRAVLPSGAETEGVDADIAAFTEWFEPWKQRLLDALRDGSDFEPLLAELEARLLDLRAVADAMLLEASDSARSQLAASRSSSAN